MTELHYFRTRPGMPSGPVALDGSKIDRCCTTASSEMVISDNWVEVSGKEVDTSGFTVVLVRRNTEQKYVLKSSAFSLGDFAIWFLKVITGFRAERKLSIALRYFQNILGFSLNGASIFARYILSLALITQLEFSFRCFVLSIVP